MLGTLKKLAAIKMRTIFFCLLAILIAGDGSEAGLGDGLIAYYPFTGNANDESGDGKHGTVVGAALTMDRFGNADSAYSFSGTNNYISIPVEINPNLLPQVTLAAWVNPQDDNPVRQIISHDNGGYDRSLCIDYRCGGTGWSCFTGDFVLGYVPVVLNEWVFVAVVYDQAAQTVNLFVNNNKISGAGSCGTGHIDTRIGCNPTWGEYFAGSIDEVRIYNRALSDAEISTLYKKPSLSPIFLLLDD